MCARYTFTLEHNDPKMSALVETMERRFHGQYQTGDILPGMAAPAIALHNDRIVPVPATFGVPSFQGGRLLINARSETAFMKKSFSEGLKKHRLLLPASGFYEWAKDEKKTKYFFTLEDSVTLYLCGIWFPIDGKIHFVILTRPANESVAPVHDRMPVIIGEDDVRPWLTDLSAAETLLATASPMLTMIG